MPGTPHIFTIYSLADFGQTDASYISNTSRTTMALSASATPSIVHMEDNDSWFHRTGWNTLQVPDTDQRLTQDLFLNGNQVGIAGQPVYLGPNLSITGYVDAGGGSHQLYLAAVYVVGVLVGFAPAAFSNAPLGPVLPGATVINLGVVPWQIQYTKMLQCFTAGTEIACQHGTRTVETLQAGDLVCTKDHGVQPVRWVARQTVPGHGPFAPICFKAGTLGNSADLMVSPMHRMLITGPMAEVLFGAPAFLAHAKDLCNDYDILPAPCREVTYFHILFDQHELVNAYGCWSESFAASKAALDSMEQAVKDELLALFPHVAATWQDALPTLSAAEVRILRV